MISGRLQIRKTGEINRLDKLMEEISPSTVRKCPEGCLLEQDGKCAMTGETIEIGSACQVEREQA